MAAHFVFVDAGIDSGSVLTGAVRPGARAVLLDPSRDGLAQIAEALAGESGVGGLTIVAHGAPGRIGIGPDGLDAAGLVGRPELAAIASALGRDATVSLYACETGRGAIGAAFLEALSKALGGVAVSAATTELGEGCGWELDAGATPAACPFTVTALAAFEGRLSVTFTRASTVPGLTTSDTGKYVVGDFDGDGADEVLFQYGNAAGAPFGYVDYVDGQMTVLTKADSPFAAFTFTDMATVTNNFSVGDYNGDGRDDLLTFSTSTGATALYLSQANGSYASVSTATLSALATTSAAARTIVGDFDGDGDTDLLSLVSLNPNVFQYAQSNGDGTFTVMNQSASPFAEAALTMNSNHTVRVADFNGDGKDDIFVLTSAAITAQMSGENGYTTVNVNSTNSYITGRLGVGDFDSDGKPEIIAYTSSTAAYPSGVVAINYVGGQFVFTQATAFPSDFPTYTNNLSGVKSGDFDGDGDVDIISGGSTLPGGTSFTWQGGNAAGSDGKPPALVSSNPADDATGVTPGSAITLTFDEAVFKGAGGIQIVRMSDGVVLQTINVTSGNIAVSGTTVTIVPPVPLEAGIEYGVRIPGGVILDSDGMSYLGGDDPRATSFTTAATPPNTDPIVDANTGATVLEGQAVTIDSGMLHADDGETEDDAGLTFTVTSTTHGTVTKDGVALGLNGTFTQDDLNNDRIQFVHDGGETTSGSFDFTLTDPDGGSLAGQSFVVEVTPANDAPTFTGEGGTIESGFGKAADAESVIVQADGKIVLVSVSGASLTHEGGLVVTRYNPDGSLDMSFGVGGSIVDDTAAGHDVVQLPNGQYLVAGKLLTSGAPGGESFLARYNADGSLDTSFGVDGKVVGAAQYYTGVQSFIAIDGDGKIVVGGSSLEPDQPFVPGFSVVRYNEDGSLDTSFAGDGSSFVGFGSNYGNVTGIAIQGDDILVAGLVSDGNVNRVIVRFTSDGQIDPTFGTNGEIRYTYTQYNNSAGSIVAQDDGRFLVTGGINFGPNYSRFVVERYTENGQLDASFGQGGRVITEIGQDSDGIDPVVQPDGTILVAGWSQAVNGERSLVVARYDEAGRLDLTFGGGDGVASVPGIGLYYKVVSLAVGADGEITVAYSSEDPTTGESHSAVVQFTSNGVLDPTFGVQKLGETVYYVENGATVRLDADVAIADPELDARNGGAGDYAGATLTLARTGGANGDDVFGFETGDFIVDGENLVDAYGSGAVFATFTNVDGVLTISFTGEGAATSALVDAVARAITYANSSERPPASVEIDWTINDGDTQSGGDAQGTTGTSTVVITPTVDAPTIGLPGVPGPADFVTVAPGDYALVAHIGDGLGGFTSTTVNFGNAAFAPVIADFAGGGANDIAIWVDGQLRILTNDGGGSFSTGPAISAPFPIDVRAADVNGDGKTDLVVIGNDGLQTLLGDGDGGFSIGAPIAVDGSVRTFELVDFNKDGDLDLVALNGSSVGVSLGDGDGGFGAQAIVAGGFRNQGLAIGDVNGDGRLDLLTGSTNGSMLWIADGNGGFSTVGLEGGYGNINSNALVDLNDDGALDIVTSGRNGLTVLIGNGAGGFEPEILLSSSRLGAVVARDIDGDGDLDLLANSPNAAQVEIYLNDGLAGFTPAPSVQLGGPADDLVAGDLNPIPGVTTLANADFVFSTAAKTAIRLTNPDVETFSVTLSVAHGALTLGGTAGIVFAPGGGDGTGDATMTFTGTAEAINAALNGLVYRPAAGFDGVDTMVVTSSGGTAGTTLVKTLPITVEVSNHAPTDITLATPQVLENSAAGTVVGALSTVDVDAGDSFTYTLVSNAGGRFALGTGLDAGKIVVANGALLDFEQATSHQITVLATDAGGLTVEKIITIAIGDVSPETVLGDRGNNVIVGGAGGDSLFGGGGNDDLSGRGGADTLDGGTGTDTLRGGLGDDTFYVDSVTDLVIEAADGGFDTVYATVTHALAAGQAIEALSAADAAATTAISLTGNEFGQALTGNAGNNTLNGRGGADTMAGLGGADRYFVDNAGDVVLETGFGGDDTVYASISYTLGAGQEIEHLATYLATGTDPINLTGNEFAQTIEGNAGANSLNGRAGADTMVGYGGDDRYFVDHALDVVIEARGGGNDTVYANADYTLGVGQEIEKLATFSVIGTAAINLAGNEFANALDGNAGANRLDGRGGVDTMTGFGGADVYLVDDAADVVIEAANGGFDTVQTSVSYTLAAGQSIEALAVAKPTTLTVINLTGNELAQTLTGSAGANTLNGRGGADTMEGLAGDDRYFVDDAGDRVIEGADGGVDRLFASVSYALGAGQSVEHLSTTSVAGTDAINLTGNEFDQTLEGNAGANSLNGRGGADTMTGYAGDDRYFVDDAGDRVIEGLNGGADTVYANVSYTLAAGQHIETLATFSSTGTAALNLTGNDFANTIIGNAGANILDGLRGADTLTGGAGEDTFQFSRIPTTVDHITDFRAVDDTITLKATAFIGLTAGALDASAFKIISGSGNVVDADDRILYDRTTGALFYDADGSGAGLSVQFATLDNKAAISAADFLIT